MVRSTIVENGRTVRTWVESRGQNKELVRKFFIKYEINAKLNGKWGRKTYETFDEAVTGINEWMQAIQKKYGFKGWIEHTRQILTHIDGTSFFAWGGGRNGAECYICEISAGEPVISEEIIERTKAA